ncbi:XdhC family protein [Mucilaginibacter auburnensis]|uniref:Xanthine/CO dehydrogenase XdhC/CoxF family maturation factor n=1 Tax=Mucilaginibacter auburnensis TaxID=1457233 RepID=A0A2H9VVY5_9SPHI|nr:XdhC/CoxI family protein [Mucilaginibacter auburnensis]PJJ84978.1 xanthine/CO dehydrogenase XdhC/CoxF family maturation factor [Mucilaginibacter auburnensis]
MKELQDIVTAFDKATAQDKQTALATVVHVEGSSYRHAGARMLIAEDGELTGAISGGCLEGDALRKARLAMAEHKPMLVTYDTTDEDDAKFGVGLGCNGIIHILIEPVSNKNANNPVALFKLFLTRRRPVVLATLFSLKDKKKEQPGTCLLLSDDELIESEFPDELIKNAVLNDARFVLKNGNSVTKAYLYEDEYTCFVELVQPAVSLVIFGAGNDAIPLTNFAAVLGWQVTVVDGRANYAVANRFPAAKQVITSKPDQALQQLTLDERTAVVLMTHNFNYDMAMLKQLLPLKLTYVGCLGPKKRLTRMLNDLQEEGTAITNDQLQTVYGPAGLDIGSENADEIALSIIAEIQSVLKKSKPMYLRNKQFIHDRAVQIIQQSL